MFFGDALNFRVQKEASGADAPHRTIVIIGFRKALIQKSLDSEKP